MCRSWSRKTFGVRGPGTALVFKELETIGKFPVDADVFENQSGAGSPHSKKRHAPSGSNACPMIICQFRLSESIDHSFARLASHSRSCAPSRSDFDFPLMVSPLTLPAYLVVDFWPSRSRVTAKLTS